MLTLSEAGKRGGNKRAQVLSKERRIEIARKGGLARAKQSRLETEKKVENNCLTT